MRALILGMALLLAGCGKAEETEIFRYQFEENGCNTGEHTADSQAQYCTNLKDEALNKFCARNLRKEAYESKGCGSW